LSLVVGAIRESEMHNKDEVAKRLIDWHFLIEPEITVIYRIISPNENIAGEPIKLLEVNEAAVETGRVQAFGFGPAGDIPFSSVVAQVTSREMQKIRSGEISLPRGWSLDTAEEFVRLLDINAA
jgi:hypothetical protein